MFNNKKYFEVNREERHYCALLAHAILRSAEIRKKLVKLVNARTGVCLDADVLEVYVEVAALRDYWNDLGNPVEYSDDTHSKRRTVLEMIITKRGLPCSILDEYLVFWTGEAKRKLWSPSKWNIEELKKAGLDSLIKIRWAFNAKPDIMLLSPQGILLIEAKLESGEGRKEESGYQQYEIQELIIDLWRLLIPEFQRRHIGRTTLELCPLNNGISWQEILSIIKATDLDPFTLNGLRQIEKYYYPTT
jgi:hypothetical protein